MISSARGGALDRPIAAHTPRSPVEGPAAGSLDPSHTTRSANPALGPCIVAGLMAAVIGISGVRGADYPTHFLRAVLWERSGTSVWNNFWYAGHPTPSYSVLTPVLTSAIGPFRLAAASAVAATALFTHLVSGLVPTTSARLAAYSFAVVVMVDVVVGRVAFGLGLTLALACVWAWSRGRIGLALTAALGTALASPVAAVFLALAAAAVLTDQMWLRRGGRVRDWSSMAVAIAIFTVTVAPTAITASVFHAEGRFPFRSGGLVATLVVLGVLWSVSTLPMLRIGSVLAALTSVAVFLVPNPLGGSFVRLPQIVAVPLCIALLARRHPAPSRALAAIVTAALLWSTTPGITAALRAVDDPSAAPEYHQPLIDEVRSRNSDGRPVGRLEIPFTENHWESYFVAAAVPYARGWERQIDLVRNPELYEVDLEREEYHRWLLDRAVRWVAVPDVALDAGGMPEARIISGEGTDRDIGWLHEVWRDSNWRLYEVIDYRPIVDPPAELIEQGPDTVVVRTPRAAVVTIRYAFTPHLTVTGGADVSESADGWITARLPDAGTYVLGVDPSAGLRGAASST